MYKDKLNGTIKNREDRIYIYNYGNGVFKVVKGSFNIQSWQKTKSPEELIEHFCDFEDSSFSRFLADSCYKGVTTEKSRSRARRRVFEYAMCNDWQYFYTQTFNKVRVDRFSVEYITKKIHNTFKDYKKRHCPDFKYLLVAELHKNPVGEEEKEMAKKGFYALHLHGLISGIKKGEIYKNDRGYYGIYYFDKALGGSSVSPINNPVASAKYVSKYICKESTQFANGYYYLCSRGLKHADVSRVVLPFDLENWKTFDFCKIYDLDLTSRNFNVINKSQQKDILSLLNALNIDSGVVGSLLDCVKLSFPEAYNKIVNFNERSV